MTKATRRTRDKLRDYQREYYALHRDERTQELRERWASDPLYRVREQERARKRRGELRAQRAPMRFDLMVAEKRGLNNLTRPPRKVYIGSKLALVWTSGSLGREVGRSSRAIRGWLREGVLPGASAFINGDAFFAWNYCRAVYNACRQVYYLDGRGDKQVLKRIILQELAISRVSYVPLGGDNERDRVKAKADVAVG